MTIYKVCSDCRAIKPIDLFHTDKNGAAMVRGNCAKCETAKAKVRMSALRRRKEKANV